MKDTWNKIEEVQPELNEVVLVRSPKFLYPFVAQFWMINKEGVPTPDFISPDYDHLTVYSHGEWAIEDNFKYEDITEWKRI